MVHKSKAEFVDHGRRSSPDSDHSRLFNMLLSTLNSPEGIRPPVLKSLYFLLVHLSLNPRFATASGIGSNELYGEIDKSGVKVTSKDICELSDVIFQQVSDRFEQYLAGLLDASKNKDHDHGISCSDLWVDAEIVLLLLRCCIVTLLLLVPVQNILLEKGQVLFGILQKLTSINLTGIKEKRDISFKKSVSHVCPYGGSDCTSSFVEDLVASFHLLEPSDLHSPFLSAMLEVFLDEFLVHRQVRVYFKLIASVASTGKFLFIPSSPGDTGIVMEIICAHFMVSFSHKHPFEDIHSRLFHMQAKEFKLPSKVPEVSLTTATSLLLNPILLSAPKFMLAHIIIVLSESSSIMTGCKKMRPDCKIINCLTSLFEKSVTLYTRHMSGLQVDVHPEKTAGLSVKSDKHEQSSPLSFESCILPDTRKKINDLISKLDDSENSYFCSTRLGTKSDLVSSSIKYIRENKGNVHESCQGDLLSILSCLVVKTADCCDDVSSSAFVDMCPQDVYFLASLLKLMGTSLLQTISCLRHSCYSSGLRTSEESHSCDNYNSLVDVISSFKDFSMGLPIQQILQGMMERHPTRHEKSRMMLLHFAGLLSLSFVTGLEFLVKGCLLVIMALLNLLVFEEGNIDVLRPLVDSCSESFSSELPLVEIQEGMVNQNSSLMVASKFQKIRTLHLSPLAIDFTGTEDECSKTSPLPKNSESSVAMEEETEETINGEIFLKCVLESTEKITDFDDLADFVECRKGKDYSAWLKDRQKFRKWKGEKMALLRWKRKKKTWKVVRGRIA